MDSSRKVILRQQLVQVRIFVILVTTDLSNNCQLLFIILLVLEDGSVEARNENPNLFRLVEAYRRYGHLKAALDPLGLQEAQ